MVVPNCDYSTDDGVFIFGDSGLNENPNAEQLAEIAKSSSESYTLLTGKESRASADISPNIFSAANV